MNISFMRCLFLSCLLGSLFLGVPRADYHYVSHSGSDEYPYTTWETAADSIQPAVDATSPHDTVYISSGQWVEHVEVQDFDSVAIVGRGRDSTFWTATEQTVEILTIDYGCLVSGITFLDHGFIGVRARYSAGVTVKDCRFYRATDCLQITGGTTEVSNCIFDSCYFAIDIPFGGGDYYIANNLIRNTTRDYAIAVSGGAYLIEKNIIINNPANYYSVCAICGTAGYLVARNNVVAYTNYGIGLGNYKYNNIALNFDRQFAAGISMGGNTYAFNNILIGNTRGVAALSGLSHINYNDFWQNEINIYQEASFDSVGNIFYYPMFVDAGGGDYHLQAFSPLIDAGDPSVLDPDSSRSDIGFYGGPFGSVYSYQDLPPGVPDSLMYRVWNDTIYLDWRGNYEADFFGYMLHRDVISGFTPSPLNLIAEPESSFYADSNVVWGQTYYYRIASLDNQGNRSEYSPEIAVTVTGAWQGDGAEMPRMTVIESNYPNPFNSATTIVYSVADLGPIPAEIKIEIYDIMGRRVRTLVNEKKEVGIYKIIWDGRDDFDNDLTSGTYFARISQWNLSLGRSTRKLTLVR